MTTRKNFRKRREARTAEAAERQIGYDAATTQSKIAICKTRRGESKKELARLGA